MLAVNYEFLFENLNRYFSKRAADQKTSKKSKKKTKKASNAQKKKET